MSRRITSRGLLLASWLLAACAGNAPAGETTSLIVLPQVWIDAPLDGAHLPLAETQLAFSGWDPAGGLSQFELSVNGQHQADVEPEYEAGEGAAKYAYSEFAWTPPAPGSYLIEVRGLGVNGLSQPALANIVVCAIDELSFEEACEPAEPAPPQVTALPAELALMALPSQNANCRLGPSATYFDVVDTLFAGSEYTPQAQGPDGLWLLFTGPAYDGDCWALSQNLDLFCDTAPVELSDVSPCTLAVVAYPPLPTLTPTPTFTPEPPLPQCSDGLDNDGDGNTDMRDPQCSSTADDSE